MSSIPLVVIALTTAIALVGLGGGLYETSVVDARWPDKPELIPPSEGVLNRKHFWIPVHVSFELFLVAALIAAWRVPAVRYCLIAAVLSHVSMRIWSGFDFIPKATAFEQSTSASFSIEAARAWTSRSLLRLPLDLVTCMALLSALIFLARQTPTSVGEKQSTNVIEGVNGQDE